MELSNVLRAKNSRATRLSSACFQMLVGFLWKGQSRARRRWRAATIYLLLLSTWAFQIDAAVGPWIKINSPANGATIQTTGSVVLSVTAGSTQSGTSVGPIQIFVNNEPKENGQSLSGLSPGTYHIWAFADVYSGGEMLLDPVEANATFTVTAPQRDAVHVATTVPVSMVVGQTYTASISMRNTGTETWTSAASYKLGSQNPTDNGTWGTGRVSLGSSTAGGQTATFTSNVTAPATAGTYSFQWRMLQEGVAWFGDITPNVVVTVLPSTIVGNLEGVYNGNIEGWACSSRLSTPIAVHLYVGGGRWHRYRHRRLHGESRQRS